jgi:hypothetical protein
MRKSVLILYELLLSQDYIRESRKKMNAVMNKYE